jgi:hypothetical protein
MNEIFEVDKFIEKKFHELEGAPELKIEDAFAIANEVAEAVTKAVLEAHEARQFERVEKLARQAENAYLLAADKVPPPDRDKIAFASSYWSLQADYARLDAETTRRRTPYQPPPGPAEKLDKAKKLTLIFPKEAKTKEEKAKIPVKSFPTHFTRRERTGLEKAKTKRAAMDYRERPKESAKEKTQVVPYLYLWKSKENKLW